jgi:hypothetical protein
MHDNDDDKDEDAIESPVYIVDGETQTLIETALNCLVTLSECQVDPSAGDALLAIADELADRFGIDRTEVVETVHTTEDGDEIIYRPAGGSILPDPEDDEET